MPQPGSHSYDVQKQKLRKELEDQGVDDSTAEEVADEAMHRKAETGDERVRPNLPPEASPSANPPGEKHHRADVPGFDEGEDMTNIAITEMGKGRFGVEIDEGPLHTGHLVEVPSDLIDDLGMSDVDHSVIVRESVVFLLDR